MEVKIENFDKKLLELREKCGDLELKQSLKQVSLYFWNPIISNSNQ